MQVVLLFCPRMRALLLDGGGFLSLHSFTLMSPLDYGPGHSPGVFDFAPSGLEV